jgi:cyclic-di-GMP phosphodiesterase TipF (flagellum assembly factor)
MRRLGSIFIAICMILIAASIAGVLFLAFKFDLVAAAVVGLAALVGRAMYNTLSSRLRDREELGDHIADLSRGTADLARQVGDLARRLNAVETSVSTSLKARSVPDPLGEELGELGTLVRALADTVAAHDARLRLNGASTPVAAVAPEPAEAPPATTPEAGPVRPLCHGIGSEAVLQAIEAQRIDLYLQPIVTLPQRKVRYYEALSRLRHANGEIVAAGDFVDDAEAAGLMPRIDNLAMFRTVQVTRRLQLKSRELGVFCNVSPSTLIDAAQFKQFLDFMDANRALADSIILEFAQSALRNFGPIEHESLSALAERGFRFSLDRVTDLRIEPRELAERRFRFLKVPAKLLLEKASAQGDIHPEDFADLLARFGIDLIAERIENESTVLDLLDYDVRFGQGFLFSVPRPVRAEALQSNEVAPAA